MAKNLFIVGEYTIEIAESGHVDVKREPRNSYRIIREIIKEKGLPIDENWTELDFARYLINKFGDGTTARFGDITINRLPDQRIEIYQTFENVEEVLREIAEKMNFLYNKEWNLYTFASELINFLTQHMAEAEKILITPRGGSKRSAAATNAAFPSSVIKFTVDQEIGSTILLRIEAKGEVTIEGVEEPFQKNEILPYYTLTSQSVLIHGAVTYLSCRDFNRNNRITSLDVSGNIYLERLICSSNLLTSLDLSHNVNLTYLDCINNQLTSLDLSRNVKLTFLDCSYNQLTDLDLTKNILLEELYCNNNLQLTHLDVSKNTLLKGIHCKETKLTCLDVSACTNLTHLECNLNESLVDLRVPEGDRQRLDMLELYGCKALKRLHCKQKTLTRLGISGCEALEEVVCSDNVLDGELRMTDCVGLHTFRCHGDNLTIEKLSNLCEALPDRSGKTTGVVYVSAPAYKRIYSEWIFSMLTNKINWEIHTIDLSPDSVTEE